MMIGQGHFMEIGIDSFAAVLPDPATGDLPSATDRMADLLEEVEVADDVGLDVFGIGEHHRAEFLDSAPAIILAAAAARTKSIRLTSAVTVLSAADPVRVFQEFATLDLIAKGRAAIIGGSFERFRPLVDLYRESGLRAGHALEQLTVGVHAMGFVGETTAKAKDAFFPGWAHLTTTIGRERGWFAPSRQQFEAMCG